MTTAHLDYYDSEVKSLQKTLGVNKIIYTPQSGTNKQDDGFNFDLIGNILKILNRVNDCGISGSVLGSDALDRNFEYDPLYRVISGDGRESNTQNQNDYLYSDAPAPGSPNSNNVRAYTRKYAFDKLGNIQQLKQLGSNGFTRNFTYISGHNTLQKIETAAPSLLEDFTYDACGNQLTAGTTRNYVWNAGNQLVTYYNQVGSADPTIFAQYDYSGMDRVSKLVKTGTSTNPIYERTIYIDGIFEYHLLENGTTYEKNYVHIMDDQSRIAMVRIGTPFPDDIVDAVVYNLEDQIGTSTIRLNKIGGIIDKEEYYPFGDSSFRTFTKKRYRYVGKEKDLESGLYYYGARYYATWTCRFISVDPLASDYPFYTPYNYAGNKPINKIDIDGMQEEGAEPVNNEGGSAKSIEELVTIDAEYATKPREPEINKIRDLKRKDYNTKDEFNAAKNQSRKEWADYSNNLGKYNFLQTSKDELINAAEGSLAADTREQILQKQVPVTIGGFESIAGDTIAQTLFRWDEYNGYSKLNGITIIYDWNKIQDLQNSQTYATSALNVKVGKAYWVDAKDDSKGIQWANSDTEGRITPTRLSVIWHELGHVYENLLVLNKQNEKVSAKQRQQIDGFDETVPIKFETTILKKQYRMK